ncbi:membrane protein of unknown function [Acidithiobacillus ferrivorans]|uniref:Uncharacterized protein n=1 Tax=Acidithiobacillus ferrivorans TaxID=160808 RepID=A0A060UUJ1_9PROT|nr:hypothetical protein [Acidithiobacillus ferrivorans]CDQ12065.1 membrane hypothetical protein [Acidithiobacillus ferrivorans]SMH64808.1 membrane protein of unknown function [Acidithiobacillus ferrivorans]
MKRIRQVFDGGSMRTMRLAPFQLPGFMPERFCLGISGITILNADSGRNNPVPCHASAGLQACGNAAFSEIEREPGSGDVVIEYGDNKEGADNHRDESVNGIAQDKTDKQPNQQPHNPYPGFMPWLFIGRVFSQMFIAYNIWLVSFDFSYTLFTNFWISLHTALLPSEVWGYTHGPVAIFGLVPIVIRAFLVVLMAAPWGVGCVFAWFSIWAVYRITIRLGMPPWSAWPEVFALKKEDQA